MSGKNDQNDIRGGEPAKPLRNDIKPPKPPSNPPVVSVYSLIRNDVWSAFHEFSIEYGVLCGLRDMDREKSKEFKEARARAVAFAVQFYLKVIDNFPDTFAELIRQDEERMSEQELSMYGNETDNYRELMRRIVHGSLNEKKKRFDIFRPNIPQVAFIASYMSRFLNVSGISAIEGRIEEQEKRPFSYGG